ncbi:MAG TPA: RNA polymerase sigma factor [Bacteroidales bacterium]|nr:RNA polymerase sigma factor [Bacteroidales bacterium]
MKPEKANTSDQTLVTGILQGKNQLFGNLYQKYHPKILSRCSSITKDQEEAKDMAQDILLKAFDHLSGYRAEASFSTWLYAITTNHYIEYYRRKNQRKFVGLEEASRLSEKDRELSEAGFRQEVIDHLLLSIDKMPLPDKELLFLRYEKDLSIKDLQKKLHLSSSGVKMRLMRVRQRLKKECVRFA